VSNEVSNANVVPASICVLASSSWARTPSAVLVAINDRYADIDEVLHAAAGADDELRTLWQTSERQRLTGAERVVANLRAKATIRLPPKAATDIVWVLTAPDQLRRLVRVRGWPLQRYERWLTGTLRSQLL